MFKRLIDWFRPKKQGHQPITGTHKPPTTNLPKVSNSGIQQPLRGLLTRPRHGFNNHRYSDDIDDIDTLPEQTVEIAYRNSFESYQPTPLPEVLGSAWQSAISQSSQGSDSGASSGYDSSSSSSDSGSSYDSGSSSSGGD